MCIFPSTKDATALLVSHQFLQDHTNIHILQSNKTIILNGYFLIPIHSPASRKGGLQPSIFTYLPPILSSTYYLMLQPLHIVTFLSKVINNLFIVRSNKQLFGPFITWPFCGIINHFSLWTVLTQPLKYHISSLVFSSKLFDCYFSTRLLRGLLFP